MVRHEGKYNREIRSLGSIVYGKQQHRFLWLGKFGITMRHSTS